MDEIMDYSKMIDVKKAIEIASDKLLSFYPEVSKVLMEEVEITDNKKHWNITLSYSEPTETIGYISFGGRRKYKIFKIDAEKGEIVSMKIRNQNE